MSRSQNLTAVAVLRKLIDDQRLSGGSSLNQVALASSLGMSRTPVRMALTHLENDGLLEPTAGGGFALRSFSHEQVVDAVGLRAVLEGSAARLAARRCNATEDLDQLDDCSDEMERIADFASSGRGPEFEQYLRLNNDFHAMLFIGAGSSVLYEAYERLLILPFALPSAILRASFRDKWLSLRLQQSRTQHRAIVLAIRAGDPDRAERLGRAHVQLTQRRLEADFATDGTMVEQLPGRNLVSLDEPSQEDTH